MSAVHVESLALHPRIVSSLKSAGLNSVEHILQYSCGDLARRTKLSPQELEGVVQLASEAILPSPCSATTLTLYNAHLKQDNYGRLSFGCPILDKALGHGVLVPGVTELAGTSGAGKTQLGLQLCLTVQLPTRKGGLGGGAVYVATEDAFPAKRLWEMAESFSKRQSNTKYSTKELTDAIFIEHSATISSLTALLEFKLPSLLRQHSSVRLVVIDSLAALFRVEFSITQTRQRAQLLRSFGCQLHRLSSRHNLAIVCCNQVTGLGNESGRGEVRPALGLAWSNMVHVRLMLHRNEVVEGEMELKQRIVPDPRILRVEFAPHLAQKSMHYFIDSEGVHGIDGNLTLAA